MGMQTNYSWALNRDSTGAYAGGTGYSDTGSNDWSLNSATASDLYFITKMCD